jgi:propanediol dehydratase small subunit
MEPPDTKIEMAASGSGASPDYAIVRAFNALRPTLGSKKNTLIVGHVLKEMGNVKPVAGVVIKKVVDYKKDTMSITIKLAENSVSTYDATIHYYVRE